jgi:hypothetical protein
VVNEVLTQSPVKIFILNFLPCYMGLNLTITPYRHQGVSEVIVIILKGFELSNKKNSKSYTDIIISKGFFTYMIYGK